jgi:hypothetical protein
LDSDGATGSHRLVGARRVEHGGGSYFGSVKKIQPLMGSRGFTPSCCLPLWGREGVTLAISTPAKKTRRDFYRDKKIMMGHLNEDHFSVGFPLKILFPCHCYLLCLPYPLSPCSGGEKNVTVFRNCSNPFVNRG